MNNFFSRLCRICRQEKSTRAQSPFSPRGKLFFLPSSPFSTREIKNCTIASLWLRANFFFSCWIEMKSFSLQTKHNTLPIQCQAATSLKSLFTDQSLVNCKIQNSKFKACLKQEQIGKNGLITNGSWRTSLSFFSYRAWRYCTSPTGIMQIRRSCGSTRHQEN